jgi:ATP-dependent protease ClpP protease subunit
MKKEILLYSYLWSGTSERIINEINSLGSGKELVMRVNSDGGSPEDTFGILAKMKEYNDAGGTTHVKVDGKARSMGLFFLAYANGKKTALDVTEGMMHRAAYSPYVESSKDLMTEAMWASLDKINGHLRAAVEATIDVSKFEEITGKTLDEVFSNEQRIDVVLTAQQMLEIGLIDEIVSITPEKKAEIEANMNQAAIAAGFVASPQAPIVEAQKKVVNNSNHNKMTIDKLKAEHPEVFAAAVQVGVTQERDRSTEWLSFVEADVNAVKAGIESGKNINVAEASRLAVLANNAKTLEAIAEGAPNATDKPKNADNKPTELSAEAKALAEFEKEVDNALKVS